MRVIRERPDPRDSRQGRKPSYGTSVWSDTSASAMWVGARVRAGQARAAGGRGGGAGASNCHQWPRNRGRRGGKSSAAWQAPARSPRGSAPPDPPGGIVGNLPRRSGRKIAVIRRTLDDPGRRSNRQQRWHLRHPALSPPRGDIDLRPGLAAERTVAVIASAKPQ